MGRRAKKDKEMDDLVKAVTVTPRMEAKAMIVKSGLTVAAREALYRLNGEDSEFAKTVMDALDKKMTRTAERKATTATA